MAFENVNLIRDNFFKYSKMTDSLHLSVKGKGFTIAIMIITGFLFGISIANCVYYSRISEKPSQAMGQNAAKAMMAINIIISILSGFVFFWSSYKLVASQEEKYNTMEHYVKKLKTRTGSTIMSEPHQRHLSPVHMQSKASHPLFEHPMALSDSE